MNLKLKKAMVALGAISIIGGAAALLPLGQESMACGWNNSGGQAFAPQQNGYSNNNSGKAITKDQAVTIVTQHVKKLNPELRIGQINDSGPLYEAEILSPSDEVLQVIGVY